MVLFTDTYMRHPVRQNKQHQEKGVFLSLGNAFQIEEVDLQITTHCKI